MINQVPQIISQTKIEETDYNPLKIIVWAAISIASSILMIYEFDQFLLTLQYAFLWFSLGALLVFSVTNILTVFFIKKKPIYWGIVFLETTIPLALFIPQLIQRNVDYLVIGALLFFAFSLFGISKGISQFKNSIKLKFFDIARLVTPKLITGILLFLSTIFYVEYFSLGSVNEKFAKEAFEGSMRSSEPIIQLWYSNISMDQSVGEFFFSLAKDQIQKNPQVVVNGVVVDMREKLKEMPTEAKTKFIGSISNELQKNLEKQIGPLDKKAKVIDVLYAYVKNWVLGLTQEAKLIMGILSAVLLFMTLKGIAFFLYGIINVIAYLVFKLLVVANFAVVTYETKTREGIILP